jgi:hypothetical protein
MSNYGVIEQDGYGATVSVGKKSTGRWESWVHFERSPELARLKAHSEAPHHVPNDFPTEEKAVLAAYDYARQLIASRLLEDTAKKM